MFFVATRNSHVLCKFDEAVIHPLAPDFGGILTPSFFTPLNFNEIDKLANMSYPECLGELIYRFCDGIISKDVLLQLSREAFADFSTGFGMANKECVGDKYFSTLTFEENVEIANLTYGPTGCCKDYGFCFTATVLNYLAKKRGEKMAVVDISGGTSGASTAWAIRNKDSLTSFVLCRARKNPSMSALIAKAQQNANNIGYAVVDADVSFINNVRYHLYNNVSFRELVNLGFINETNILNILSYLPVFLKSYIKCNARPFSVCVPTGNMSLGMASYFAKKLGIPIRKIVLAVEKDRFFPELQASKVAINSKTVEDGFSSFHVEVPTNFERLLFYLYDSNQSAVKRSMTELESNMRYKIQDYLFDKFEDNFFVAQSDNQFSMRQTIYSAIREKSYYVEQHFSMAKMAMDIAIGALGSSFANSPIVLFNTLDFRRNLEFVNASLGYDVENPNLPWTTEDIQKFCPIELASDKAVMLQHVLEALQDPEKLQQHAVQSETKKED